MSVEGSPISPEELFVPLSRPHLTDLERDAVSDAMSDGWVSGTGPHVAKLEQLLADRTGRAHVLAVANGTLALEVALRSLGVGPGDQVVVPCLTFAAPASSVMAVGAEVVLADITEESWTLDPAQVAAVMTDRVRAIIAVDLLGHPSDYSTLRRFGVPIIQDAAEAHGAIYRDDPVGRQGDVSVFSFHANKAVTTGEGGSVGTDDDELADRMRLIINHGMRPSKPYVHEVVGRNHRMTNLSAALGVAQMQRWEELVDARKRVGKCYSAALEPLGGLSRPEATWSTPSTWLHTLTVTDRDLVVSRIRERGIDARGIWPPLHRQPFLQHTASSGLEYPVASRLSATTLWLPTFSGMSETDLAHVVTSSAAALASGGPSAPDGVADR